MIYINAGGGESGLNAGLGKSKFLKKIQIKKIAKPIAKAAKQVSIKNAVKVAKFAAPIAVGFIPVGGGIASKLMNSKIGKIATKVKNSKLVKKAIAVKKVLGKGSKGEEVKALQEELGVKPDGDFGPKTEQALEQATGQKTIAPEAIPTITQTPVPVQAPVQMPAPTQVPVPTQRQAQPMEEEPQGKMTAVKPYEELPQTQGIVPAMATPAPKDNTMLYVGGAVALAGIAYLATKKK